MTTAQLLTESLHARISRETIAQLDQIASSLGRSRNWIFNEALKEYIETQQWQLDLIQKRAKEANNSRAKLVFHDQLMNRQEKRLKKKLKI